MLLFAKYLYELYKKRYFTKFQQYEKSVYKMHLTKKNLNIRKDGKNVPDTYKQQQQKS